MVELSPTVLFLVILVSVPLQFYLSPRSTSDADFYWRQFYNQARSVLYRLGLVSSATPERPVDPNAQKGFGYNDLYEDELIDDDSALKTDYFGNSQEPRDPRAPYVQFRVGQVIRHKVHGYRAVIVGWDEKARAPDWWLEKVHKGRKDWSDSPNYVVLIDTRDRLVPQLGYIVEENIELSKGAVVHPLVKHYFESFDGTCYKMRPWRKALYPND
ncbi:hemimethylated DNA binding domain-containing protein [Aphelenchoides avenae]|nr:hemimethylated DNA binding domain-containing protein [Aphelenchus avenae]